MIKILVDSASDITEEEARQKGIHMIPLEVRFGEDVYLDGVNLLPQEFLNKLIESNELPKTSQINEFRWTEQFEKLTANGDQVIAITISSKLSGTYNSAKAAAKKFPNQVFVVDSLTAATGERILCDYALRLVAEGKTAEVIHQELEQIKHKVQVIAVVDTLKYLRKGGRISTLTAFAGELLSIKPVISVTGGEVKMVGKAMGSKKSNNLLMQLVQKCGGIDFNMPYGVIFSGYRDEYLRKYLEDSAVLWQEHVASLKEIPVYMYGSTIGTHVGPNALGVAFFAK
ncbi:MAG: DegV family protein [Clostridia bacterium]|nr:DegV family protein [Clostridia bacterium]